MNRIGFVLAALAVVAAARATTSETRVEYIGRLVGDLFKDYDKNIIPQMNSTKPVDFTLGVKYYQMDMNENGELESTLWMYMDWTDERLAWDPKEYHGLEQLRYPANQLWRPDISLYNSLSYGPGSFSDSLQKAQQQVIIFPTGKVMWIPAVNAKVACTDKDFADWPWGEYDCSMTFGSWTFSSEQLNLIKSGDADFIGSEDTHKTSNAFFTENSFSENALEAKKYDCCPELYQSLKFQFKVQRRSLMTSEGKKVNPNPVAPYPTTELPNGF